MKYKETSVDELYKLGRRQYQGIKYLLGRHPSRRYYDGRCFYRLTVFDDGHTASAVIYPKNLDGDEFNCPCGKRMVFILPQNYGPIKPFVKVWITDTGKRPNQYHSLKCAVRSLLERDFGWDRSPTLKKGTP